MIEHQLDTLSTARLRGERITPAHLDEVRTLQQNEDFTRYNGGNRDEAGVRSWLERQVAHWEQHGFGAWLLRYPPDVQAIGSCAVRHTDVEGKQEVAIGYAFLPEFWGRGLATEIALECTQIARDTLGLDYVVAATDPRNLASQRVLAKVGFVFDRTFETPEGRGALYRLVFEKEDIQCH